MACWFTQRIVSPGERGRWGGFGIWETSGPAIYEKRKVCGRALLFLSVLQVVTGLQLTNWVVLGFLGLFGLVRCLSWAVPGPAYEFGFSRSGAFFFLPLPLW